MDTNVFIVDKYLNVAMQRLHLKLHLAQLMISYQASWDLLTQPFLLTFIS